MPAELKQHYVAFLDILGFSDMVHADVMSQEQVHLAKLFGCHQRAGGIFQRDPECTITQFSDSIVIARPYDPEAFAPFVKGVAEYQRLLLDEELLCRGGIAVNKHFSNGSFTFSAGVIDAYRLESVHARNPRVVVSLDLLELLFPKRPIPGSLLIREDDGLYFVDYLGITGHRRPASLRRVVTRIVAGLLSRSEPSLREKGIWMAAYADSALETTLGVPKFEIQKP